MDTFLRAVALGAVAATIGAGAAIAAPSNNAVAWHFVCNGGSLAFDGVKTDSSSSTWHITSGGSGNFVAKTIITDAGSSTNNGYSGSSQNSSSTIDCFSTSPITGTTYELIGVITPQS
jgi:hypothetical protein